MNNLTSVESWSFYEEMVKSQEYGEIVSSEGNVVLSSALEAEADLFISKLRGRSSVIDVGSGLGFPSLVLAPHVGHLVAVDGAPTMVNQLTSHIERLGYENMRVVRAEVEAALPLDGERFDGASICGTVGSLNKPERMLEELHRVMRPAGIVVCAAENFADKLALDEGKEFRWFRMNEGLLCLQVIEYLHNPHRIRDSRYTIRESSDLYQGLLAEHEGALTWRAPTDRRPEDLPTESFASAVFDEAIQYDPEGLKAAFEEAGFKERSLELKRNFRVEHIHAVFEKG
ncbi:MAG: methyltransferase domain-containing protein [Armatimonadetes bacterium]|nr:methyltransferase domain-containing protein [Armatimonadota bacterium]NIM24955.1 methyltransferase domain-containing protein [Armatimonadota bacterium]NIM68841.1 methyltransferase domain-containing protein [Armatimonadota bacterium]NIM76667.1 methyltransferase domain-containing protein [Armatimonadota bacterium]NIN07046.1 methyltransferase domain-containing protein [Armatimonadota bacterium]